MDFDPFDGLPSVMYNIGGQTLYRHLDSFGWSTEVVESVEAFAIQLRHDASGMPVAGYLGAGVTFSERLTSTWAVEVVGNSNGGSRVGFALSPAGNPSFAHFASGRKRRDPSEVRFVTRIGNSWESETIGYEGQSDIALAFDESGQPMVAWRYEEGGDAYVIMSRRDASGSWSDEVAWGPSQTTSPRDVNLAWDSIAGEPFIVIRESFGTGQPDPLRALRRSAGAWTVETIDSEDERLWSPSLAIDSIGLPAVAYAELEAEEVRLARWDGAQWNVEVVDDTTEGNKVTLRFDSFGNPGIFIVEHREAHGSSTVPDEVILYLK